MATPSSVLEIDKLDAGPQLITTMWKVLVVSKDPMVFHVPVDVAPKGH